MNTSELFHAIAKALSHNYVKLRNVFSGQM